MKYYTVSVEAKPHPAIPSVKSRHNSRLPFKNIIGNFLGSFSRSLQQQAIQFFVLIDDRVKAVWWRCRNETASGMRQSGFLFPNPFLFCNPKTPEAISFLTMESNVLHYRMTGTIYKVLQGRSGSAINNIVHPFDNVRRRMIPLNPHLLKLPENILNRIGIKLG
jgi:hypothetical protein